MMPKKRNPTRTSATAAIGKLMRQAERDRIMAGVPMPVFNPLVSWPAVPHFRQDELDALRAIPSLTR